MSTSQFSNTRDDDALEHEHSNRDELKPTADFLDYLRDYAREKPEVAALWCLGIGFLLGWKLKPW